MSIRSTNQSDLPHPLGAMTFDGDPCSGEDPLSDFDPDTLVADHNSTEPVVALESRTMDGPPLCCLVTGQDWQVCRTDVIRTGIWYLKNLNGLCGVGARSCVRISCSHNSAIYLCSDPSCTYLAGFAQDIVNVCVWWTPILDYTCGQEFDTDSFNVIMSFNPGRDGSPC
ncbi:uncharacterized protein LY89DRAFT_720238 [Mollisia scopiformis]|uniref:Uncharacterized protein n=1 Tax=Mollisia scopiformis TaxID=149040 RepID=A0A194X3J5_MOLSC|nr:uncharacterized protein LY89DRAFT_720238 [Mollisia scopiformis]KUJ14763.1 hypothetical protein LY89DRAFT_720238 [Mollisia scopiformis]